MVGVVLFLFRPNLTESAENSALVEFLVVFVVYLSLSALIFDSIFEH